MSNLQPPNFTKEKKQTHPSAKQILPHPNYEILDADIPRPESQLLRHSEPN